MGMMDDLGDKAKDMMNDPATKQKVEQIAKDKAISVEQAAKEHLSQQQNNG